tara:strand:+ start:803 stop:1072 length:270 start_codon:yes stop_codon:yes gene_type:complete
MSQSIDRHHCGDGGADQGEQLARTGVNSSGSSSTSNWLNVKPAHTTDGGIAVLIRCIPSAITATLVVAEDSSGTGSTLGLCKVRTEAPK